MSEKIIESFRDLPLNEQLIAAIDSVGYEKPSPIQAETIPLLVEGRDVLGQAQTGTGKTAAFALPILQTIDLDVKKPQAMILAPTRELAIQVAEAFQTYATKLKGFQVLPIYGGQDYGIQLRNLKRGPQVIVGTPGRVMDHMRKGTLQLGALKTLVLDEADEMLRMGFIDDVEWILDQTPDTRQIALFSATMPDAIRRIATKYLNNPEQVTIKNVTATAPTITQRYWVVSGTHKLDALTRMLEFETFDGMIIFVRTKNSTVELAEKLEARGYASAALNGDIPQAQRERTVDRLKSKKLDILVATDVVARGLDVERISHVINYDVPYDTESYVHRIGRTGRAGRTGDAILFIAPRERRMLKAIERATKQKIAEMELPSADDINDKRIEGFKNRITDTLGKGNLQFYTQLIEQYQVEHNISATEIAAALAQLAQGDEPFLIKDKPRRERPMRERDSSRGSREPRESRDSRGPKGNDRGPKGSRKSRPVEEGMDRFVIAVGRDHGVKPGNIVGAIANECGLDSEFIGHIGIEGDHSTVDLPSGMPKDVFEQLRRTRVCGQALNISKAEKKKKEPYKAKKDQAPGASRGKKEEK
ncbi:ATP-dependent RNA helicase [Gammaproteobacteria bacterium 45_16_T64]|nr:ATP-dependent RNA helicase [Gammaproteobacteria bacterium 45_16_T64]